MASLEQKPFALVPPVGSGNSAVTSETSPIMKPENRVSDPIWGIQAPAGGVNAPLDPEIPSTKGE